MVDFGVFRSDVSGRTNFGILREILGRELTDSSVRSPRNVQFVYHAIGKLNSRFSGDITENSHRCFPDEYFTCPAKCKVWPVERRINELFRLVFSVVM